MSASSTRTVPLIYIAAPYRAETKALVRRNVKIAEIMGRAVARAGGYPVMPTRNTHGFEDVIDEPAALAATMGLMFRLDGVLAWDVFGASKGVQGEIDEATRTDRLGPPLAIEDVGVQLIDRPRAHLMIPPRILDLIDAKARKVVDVARDRRSIQG